MRETWSLVLALLLGSLLGATFFGGLWWTIRKGISSKVPALWFLGSILVRTMIAVVGFHLVARGDWHRLVASLLGFLLARAVATRVTRAPVETSARTVKAGEA
jgi:F1F0 ATPase subunit 2